MFNEKQIVQVVNSDPGIGLTRGNRYPTKKINFFGEWAIAIEHEDGYDLVLYYPTSNAETKWGSYFDIYSYQR